MIKHNVLVRGTARGAQDKIGCLLRPLKPSFETDIQRYMQEIELQLKNIGYL